LLAKKRAGQLLTKTLCLIDLATLNTTQRITASVEAAHCTKRHQAESKHITVFKTPGY
jgi:hypothetical protein